MKHINLVKELRESKGLMPGAFFQQIESIIYSKKFQAENKALMEKYDGFVKLRPDYITRWEETGRVPEDPVVRQALCVFAQKSFGELLLPNETVASSILVSAFKCSKSQNEIANIINLNKLGIIKVNLFNNDVPHLVSYVAEVLSLKNNLSADQINFAEILNSQINMAELLDVMQKSCQVTTPTTHQLMRDAKINAYRYILTALVPCFKN